MRFRIAPRDFHKPIRRPVISTSRRLTGGAMLDIRTYLAA
jgi:hypothetical protein